MLDSITVLHISDMQFGKFHRFVEKNGDLPNAQDNLFTRLVDDLKQLATDNKLRPDMIICTGDLAEWAMGNEFDAAFEFLGKLCVHYDLPRSRCIVIPGNHDINRSHCEAYFNECKGDGRTPVFPWFPKWKNFKAAFDTFYAGISGITFDQDTPWSLFVHEDLRVVVAGINSTMDEGHDAAVNSEERADKGHHGLCTEEQLIWFKENLSDDRFKGWLRIGAVHHNVIRGCRSDGENLIDADLLGGILGDHLHLLLHGHTHEAKADMLATKVRVYSTGSAALKTAGESSPVPTDVPNQYQVLVITRESVERYCRQLDPRGNPPRFIADPRQSTSGSEWIIHDRVSFKGLAALTVETTSTWEQIVPIQVAPNLIKRLPDPPAFYASPPYIGQIHFIGRNAQIQTLNEWAKQDDPTSVLLFEAIGGNGKSMLAWEWVTKHAEVARADWAGRFWYSFYEKGAVMRQFCQHALAYMTKQPLDAFAEQSMSEMREALTAELHRKPWLLILDGLERVLVAYHRIDAAEVRDEELDKPGDKILDYREPCNTIREEDTDLLRDLAAATPSKILITSRLKPRALLNQAGLPMPGIRPLMLPGLEEAEAEELLRSLGVEGTSADIRYYLTTYCGNHPLVIGVLAGLVNAPGPHRGNFDSWAADPEYGAKLNLASLDLVKSRNHILLAAIDSLEPASRQLLSTLALSSSAVDYETIAAFNPHAQPGTKELGETIVDLEHRGMLQYDSQDQRYDLHPVVRGVAVGSLRVEDKERYGQLVVDYFNSKPHSPYRKAKTMRDVESGIQVVRALIRLGRYQQAADAFQGDLSYALNYNLEAHVEVLSLLRPFFTSNWDHRSLNLNSSSESYLANAAAIALDICGESKLAARAFIASLRVNLKREDWEAVYVSLSNVSLCLHQQNQCAQSLRVSALALELANALGDEQYVMKSLLDHSHYLAHIGRWTESEAIQKRLDPAVMIQAMSRGVYRQGDAELIFAQSAMWQETMQEGSLNVAESLAERDNNRYSLRLVCFLRGAWRLGQREWTLAAESFTKAVTMAREVRIVDGRSETGLALAKFHLGQLTPDNAREEAKRLSELRSPDHRSLALLWQAIGDLDQAKDHAIAAYTRAWADGEPYVIRYELTKTTELLNELGVPIPSLPPYDPEKDEPFPWEADLGAAIDKLRAQKASKEDS